MTTPPLPYLDPSHLTAALRDTGYALLRPDDVALLAGCSFRSSPRWSPAGTGSNSMIT